MPAGSGRRALLAALPTLMAPWPARAAAPLRVTDVLGRVVTLPGPARRIALAQARHILAMALLHDDPVSLVTGWGDDLRQMNPPDYAVVRERFPRADAIPVITRGQGAALSVEALIDGQPDLVVLSLNSLGGLGRDLPDQFTAAGIPTVVIDFFQDPMRHTRASMQVLGAVMGAQDRAAAFDTFYGARLSAIAGCLRGASMRPRVLIHAHAGGIACCASPGRGAYDSMVRFAGGHNIGADLLPGVVGELSLEQAIDQAPDLYVATGGPYGARGGVPLGPGVTTAAAQRALAEVIRRSHLDSLTAVQAGRSYAIWHGFNDTPAHVVMLEILARWFHPDRCAALNPAATLATLNERFLSIPMQGTHWIDLPTGAL